MLWVSHRPGSLTSSSNSSWGAKQFQIRSLANPAYQCELPFRVLNVSVFSCASLPPDWFILAARGVLPLRVQTWCLPLGRAQGGASSPTSSEWRPTGICLHGREPSCRGHTLPPSWSKKSPLVSVGVCAIGDYSGWRVGTEIPCGDWSSQVVFKAETCFICIETYNCFILYNLYKVA